MRVFEPILAALTGGGVRFVVVGGVATVLHGHPRFTAKGRRSLPTDRQPTGRGDARQLVLKRAEPPAKS